MTTIEIDGIQVKFNQTVENPCYTVVNSYKLTTKLQVRMFLEKLWVTKDYIELCSMFHFTRTDRSQVEEIASHNFLYNLGVLTARTKDTDVNNNVSKLALLGYKLVSIFYF